MNWGFEIYEHGASTGFRTSWRHFSFKEGAVFYLQTIRKIGTAEVASDRRAIWNFVKRISEKENLMPLFNIISLLLIYLLPLVFPTILKAANFYAWSTFYGPNNGNYPQRITLDSGENILALGNCSGTWSGPSGEAPLHSFNGGEEFSILKLTHAGSYLWHTFYGGGRSKGYGIKSDANGNVYITGESYISWIGPQGQKPLNAFNGDVGRSNIFLLKLDGAGTYQWHSFYGTSNGEASGTSLAVDSDGDVYVVGSSYGGMLGPEGEAPILGGGGGLLMKIDTNGNYQWHQFFCSGPATGIARVDSGYYYVSSQGCDNLKGPQGQDPLFKVNGTQNPGILKFDSDGIYQWHVIYEGWGKALAVDGNSNIFIAGDTHPNCWKGPEGQEPLNDCNGEASALEVLKINNNGNYLWHTFYGGFENIGSGMSGMALDSEGNVLMVGWSPQNWHLPGCQNALELSGTGLLLKLDNNGNYQWRNGFPIQINGITVDSGNNVFITSGSPVLWFGPHGEPPLNIPDGYNHIFIEKLFEYKVRTLGETQTNISPSCTTSGANQPVTFTATVTDCFCNKRPTGAVAFKVNGLDYGTKALDGNGQAIFTIQTLPVGNVTIRAEYSGDNDYYGSTKEITQDVRNLSPTTLALSSSNNHPVAGETVTFTAKVSYCNETQKPSGTITFIIDNRTLGSQAIDNNGIATFTIDSILGGSHQIKAKYDGDSAFDVSIGDISLPVDKAFIYMPLILNKHLVRECRKGTGTPPGLYYVSLMPNSALINSNAQIFVQFSFTDPNGDLDHGAFNYAAPSGQTVSIPLPEALAGIPYGTVGAAVIITTDSQKGTFKIPTWLVDKAGNCSNIVYVDWIQY
jgi:hypothetical protein